MDGIGDMTARLGLDATGYTAGLSRAAGEAKRFSTNWSSALQSAGYAIQDFASQIGNRGLSGALGAISNNVAQIGAAFGPTGMLVGGVAMASISAWQMYEAFSKSEEKVVDISKSLQAARGQIDGMVANAAGLRDFATRLAGIRRPEDAAAMKDANRREMTNLEEREAAIRTQINSIGEKAGIGELFVRAMADPNADMADQFLEKLDRLDKEGREKVRGLVGDFRAVQRAMNDNVVEATQIEQAIKRAAAAATVADAMKAGIQAGQQAANDAMKRMKAEKDRRDELIRETQTPMEALESKLKRLRQDFRDGIITEQQFDLFGDRMLNRFGRETRSTDRDAGAMLRGSMEEVRAVLAATRPTADDPQKQQLDVLKQQLEAEKEAVRLLRQKPKPLFNLLRF